MKKNVTEPVTEDDDDEINVLRSFHTHPQSSILSAAHDFDISTSSVQKIGKQSYAYLFLPTCASFQIR